MPPTKLGTNHRRRTHWSEINDLTEQCKVLYQQEIREQCQSEVPFFEYAHVTFEQVVPSFRAVTDNDNLSGRTKPVLDAMVLVGMFKDDNAKCVEVTYRTRLQQKCKPWLRVLVSQTVVPEPLSPCSNGSMTTASTSSLRGSKTRCRRSNGESLHKRMRHAQSTKRSPGSTTHGARIVDRGR